MRHAPLPQLARDWLSDHGIPAQSLSPKETVNLAFALNGVYVVPITHATDGPITARVWLTAALLANGHYMAPETDGHPADLEDGGPPIDSAVLMLVIQRHHLPTPAPGWDDNALADELGVDSNDFQRTQAALDAARRTIGTINPATRGGMTWPLRTQLDRHGVTHTHLTDPQVLTLSREWLYLSHS